MSLDRRARFAICCVAGAVGATLAWTVGARSLAGTVQWLFFAAAYFLTQDAGGSGSGRDLKYWRGRPVDDHRDRWH